MQTDAHQAHPTKAHARQTSARMSLMPVCVCVFCAYSNSSMTVLGIFIPHLLESLMINSQNGQCAMLNHN